MSYSELMTTYIRLFKGLTMKSSLYEVLCPHRGKSDVYVHIHQDFQRFDNGIIIAYEVLCPHRDKSDVYVDIHQDFHRFDNGVIIVYEVLCPHRDKSDFYVHMHQDFQRFDNSVIIVKRQGLCPHRDKSDVMSTYIRIFNGSTMVLSFYRRFCAHIEP